MSNVFELFARLIVGLALVLGLLMVIARMLRRRGIDLGAMRTVGARPAIDLVARRALTRTASVAIVRAAGKTLILGITDSQVTVLGDSDWEPEEGAPEAHRTVLPTTPGPVAGGNSPWKMALESLRERTVRRD